MRVKQEVNEIYSPLFLSNERYVVMMGGRGAGRSTAASQFVVASLLGKPFFRCAIMRAVHSDIRHSIWKDIVDRIKEKEIETLVRMVDTEMYIEYGRNSVRAHGFRASSSSLTARLKSLANYNCVIIEEAEEIGEQEFGTLDDSLRTIWGKIKIVFALNPPHRNHWIIQRFFDLESSGVEGFYIPKLKPDVDAIHIGGTRRDNLVNLAQQTVEQYDRYKQTDPQKYWNLMEGLVPEVLRGKIFSGWRQIDTLPFGARLVRYGLDFGWFPDPTVLVAIYEFEGEYILEELLYGTEIANETIAGIIRNKNKGVLCVADNEERSINEIRKYGVNITATEKGPDSVSFRIKTTANLKISVLANSPNIWKAYENYAWKEDKDGNPTGKPDHLYSHCMDAAMYGIISLPTIQQKEEHRRYVSLTNWQVRKKKTNVAY